MLCGDRGSPNLRNRCLVISLYLWNRLKMWGKFIGCRFFWGDSLRSRLIAWIIVFCSRNVRYGHCFCNKIVTLLTILGILTVSLPFSRRRRAFINKITRLIIDRINNYPSQSAYFSLVHRLDSSLLKNMRSYRIFHCINDDNTLQSSPNYTIILLLEAVQPII